MAGQRGHGQEEKKKQVAAELKKEETQENFRISTVYIVAIIVGFSLLHGLGHRHYDRLRVLEKWQEKTGISDEDTK
ncbi:hypothetical protein [Texcoconibacillus texcoconensis]|uniref:Uncharacterized protein n=1 Tax=Texcoconibacillus texcoconensis TaxID=1095777 RepID=A0A840QNK0_9BACI|nr:hypothetical protein [Texcoconibacillus texcoconensis]MBB5172927.1 hypothetical protein [Texcoconibacillus texcoconensis]